MALYGNIFKKPVTEDYLKEAVYAANFINSRRIETEHGIYFSMEDTPVHEGEAPYYDEICMYAGSTGVAHYFIQLYKVTGEKKYLEDAQKAAEYIIWRWKNKRELKRNFSKWAFSTGYSGVGHFLLELVEITGNKEYSAVVEEIVEAAIKDAKPSDDGIGFWWSSYPGIVGDAGTILFILEAGKTLKHQEYVDFAVKASEIYLSRVRDYKDGGRYYLGVDPKYFKGDENYIDPNFPMGTGGIGFVLLKMYQETGRKEFLDGVEGLPEFMEKVALKSERGGRLLPHGLPSRPDTYYLGYCHGPVGTARFFYELNKVTGKTEHKDFELNLARGIIDTGAPEYHSNGWWHIHCLCCGTAGFLHLFLSIWATTGDEEFFKYAERTARSLLGWSYHTEGKDGIESTWHQAFAYVNQKETTTKIGMYDGTAGIASCLLEFYTALLEKEGKGKFYGVRAIDDPYPSNYVAGK